jgi:hypothetical protein
MSWCICRVNGFPSNFTPGCLLRTFFAATFTTGFPSFIFQNKHYYRIFVADPKAAVVFSIPHITEQIITSMASLAAGDARAALSLLEHVILAPADTSQSALLASLKHSVATSYDRTGGARYDLISALHKCIRGNQGGAALYWLARMLEADEDPMYIARRLVVCASEDVGMADPHALPLVSTAMRKKMVIAELTCVNRPWPRYKPVKRLECQNAGSTSPMLLHTFQRPPSQPELSRHITVPGSSPNRT